MYSFCNNLYIFVSSRKAAMSIKQAANRDVPIHPLPRSTCPWGKRRGVYRNAAMHCDGVGLIMSQQSIRRTSNCKSHIGVFVQ